MTYVQKSNSGFGFGKERGVLEMKLVFMQGCNCCNLKKERGAKKYEEIFLLPFHIPCIDIDWFPVKEPYDISMDV